MTTPTLARRGMRADKLSSTLALVCKYAVLILASAATLFPLLWTICNSFRSTEQIMTSFVLIPEQFKLDNYKTLFEVTDILRAFRNSVSVTAVSLLLLCALVLPVSFAISRYKFRMASKIYGLFSFAIMVPAISLLPMLYRQFSEMHLLGYKYSITFAYAIDQLPISVFLVVAFMRTIPMEIDEAAVIDGCSTWDLFWRFILPLSRNGIITMLILAFVAIWNDYMIALVLQPNVVNKTLSVILTYAKGEYFTDYGMMCAAVVFAVMPMLVFYFLIKNMLISGMVLGAVKG